MAFTGLYRSGTGNSSEAIARVEMNELMKALNEELEDLGLCIDAEAFMWLVLEVLVDQRKLLAQKATPPLSVAGIEAYTAGGFDLSELSPQGRSEEHTSELQSLMRSSYAVFCLKKKK